MNQDRPHALEALRVLHARVDEEASQLAARHAERLSCRRGCSGCCQDDLTVTQVEAALIVDRHVARLANEEPGPRGGCAFLDAEGACRVYAERPLICRTQGLPLRAFFESDEGDIEEQRDICPLNLEGGPALETLADEDLWLIGPFELQLTELDREYRRERVREGESGDASAQRVALRALFGVDSVRAESECNVEG